MTQVMTQQFQPLEILAIDNDRFQIINWDWSIKLDNAQSVQSIQNFHIQWTNQSFKIAIAVMERKFCDIWFVDFVCQTFHEEFFFCFFHFWWLKPSGCTTGNVLALPEIVECKQSHPYHVEWSMIRKWNLWVSCLKLSILSLFWDTNMCPVFPKSFQQEVPLKLFQSLVVLLKLRLWQ